MSVSFAADVHSEEPQLKDFNFTLGHIGFSNMAISISTTVKNTRFRFLVVKKNEKVCNSTTFH